MLTRIIKNTLHFSIFSRRHNCRCNLCPTPPSADVDILLFQYCKPQWMYTPCECPPYSLPRDQTSAYVATRGAREQFQWEFHHSRLPRLLLPSHQTNQLQRFYHSFHLPASPHPPTPQLASPWLWPLRSFQSTLGVTPPNLGR